MSTIKISDYFKLKNNLSANGTSFHGVTVTVDPERLFGLLSSSPRESFDGKTSQEWVFEGPLGEVFTLYDWKSTSLYDSSLPSPVDYWLNKQVTLHIGHLAAHKTLAQILAAQIERLAK